MSRKSPEGDRSRRGPSARGVRPLDALRRTSTRLSSPSRRRGRARKAAQARPDAFVRGCTRLGLLTHQAGLAEALAHDALNEPSLRRIDASSHRLNQPGRPVCFCSTRLSRSSRRSQCRSTISSAPESPPIFFRKAKVPMFEGFAPPSTPVIPEPSTWADDADRLCWTGLRRLSTRRETSARPRDGVRQLRSRRNRGPRLRPA